jgi:prepilin-type N-terminal cleavage/methylation domain-containing protein
MRGEPMIRKNNGLTLIELMIALLISSLLLGVLYQIFIGQQKAYAVQEQVVDTQQNVRAAIDQMTQEIRMAGYRKDILTSLGNINGYTQLITPVNSANYVGHNDDQITIIIADKAITYKLQPDSRGPILVRDENTGAGGQLMAENVENLQIRYTLSDGTVTDSPATPETIRMIQVTVRARTKMTDPDLGGDGYRRRELTTLIKLRNFGL